MTARTQDLKKNRGFLRKKLKALFSTPIFGHYLRNILELQDWFIIPSTPEQKKLIRHIKELRQDTRIGLNNHEAYQVYKAVMNTTKVPGSLAEVGVFEGGTARLISEAMGSKKLYLFDTFEGLPNIQKIDEGYFSKGQFVSNYNKVAELFLGKNITISKGLFPSETAHVAEKENFSFVHLDVDLYEGTKDSLEFFYPRMSKGGVIICHDYTTAPGVRKAVDDFFNNKPEVVLEPSRSQALIVKLS